MAKVVYVDIRLGAVDGEPVVITLSDDDQSRFDVALSDVPWDNGTSVYDSKLELTISDDGTIQSHKLISERPVVSHVEATEDEDDVAPVP